MSSYKQSKQQWLNKLSQNDTYAGGLVHELSHAPIPRRDPPTALFHDPA
jgi:hypothetical protein